MQDGQLWRLEKNNLRNIMKNVYKSYKYRIYPSKEQEVLIAKTFGCCRYIYNTYLIKRIEAHKRGEKLTYNCCSADMTELKKRLKWLSEVDSLALGNSLRDLDVAYRNFFQKKAGFPKCKRKKGYNRLSYRTTFVNGNIKYFGNHIKLPKLGMVRTKNKLVPQGRICYATIVQEPSGRFYVSLCCANVAVEKMEKTGHSCEITTEVLNDVYECVKREEERLAKLRKKMSRKKKDSSNRNKARIEAARLQEHIANAKNDAMQKISTRIIEQNDTIVIRDSEGSKDIAWRRFIDMLTYKADWHERQIIFE